MRSQGSAHEARAVVTIYVLGTQEAHFAPKIKR